MKINYFFPIKDCQDAKSYFNKFFKTDFYKQYQEKSFIFVCQKEDKRNLEYLNSLAIKNSDFKIIICETDFSYNDAFYLASKFFDGDVVLLGDIEINNIEFIFKKYLEKYSKKVNIVHVCKKRNKIKGASFSILKGIYNFFIHLFTSRKDKLNIISLGLLDKDIMDLIKALPQKGCFLKNVNILDGFVIRTIYIDDKIKTFKQNFKKKSLALICSIVSACVLIALIALTTLTNIFIKANLTAYNIIECMLIMLSITTIALTLPKHIFDVRNNPNIEHEIKCKYQNFDNNKKDKNNVLDKISDKETKSKDVSKTIKKLKTNKNNKSDKKK